MNEHPTHEGEWLSFHTICRQADEFLADLTDMEKAHFAVAAAILENSIRWGRPPAGRARRIAGSKLGLYELRITPAGSPGPQLRLLYVLEGGRALCARGVSKRQRRLSRRDIDLAEKAVKAYRASRRERSSE